MATLKTPWALLRPPRRHKLLRYAAALCCVVLRHAELRWLGQSQAYPLPCSAEGEGGLRDTHATPQVCLVSPTCACSGGPEVPQPSAALPAPSGDDSGKAAGEGEAPPGTSGMPGTVGRPSLAAANAGSRAKKLAQIRERMLMASLDEVHHEPYLSRWMAPGLPMWMPLPQAQDSEQGQAAASPAGDGGRPAVPAGSGTGTGVDAPAGSAPASPAPGSAQLPGSGAVQVSAVQQQGSRPLGAAGGSGSPQPGSPQPSGPPTPGRRPQQGPSAPSLLQALCCCSSAVIPASSRDAVHFAVDFRSECRCLRLPVGLHVAAMWRSCARKLDRNIPDQPQPLPLHLGIPPPLRAPPRTNLTTCCAAALQGLEREL